MLTAVAQLKVTPAQLAQRKFPIEMLSAVLDKETGELIILKDDKEPEIPPTLPQLPCQRNRPTGTENAMTC